MGGGIAAALCSADAVVTMGRWHGQRRLRRARTEQSPSEIGTVAVFSTLLSMVEAGRACALEPYALYAGLDVARNENLGLPEGCEFPGWGWTLLIGSGGLIVAN